MICSFGLIRPRGKDGQVVRGLDEQPKASLREFAAHHLPASDRGAFVELAETEIERLHEGTIARYRLRPSDYDAWKRRRS